MKVVVVTGSAGLIGAEAVRFFAARGHTVVGIDNDMRKAFFGDDASTEWSRRELESSVPNYLHRAVDIRDRAAIESILAEFGSDIYAIIHTAAQPSHDWAARDPHTDFSINVTGTLNLLEGARKHCPKAAFVFTSTNKVYGDHPNRLPLVEWQTRWEVDPANPYHAHGIDESMPVDHATHSLLGASKLAADIFVQEYGRYFGMNTACFRAGCLTGPGHSGTMLHGFLSYLARCAVTSTPYTILGYKGKQVRDNIHSYDLVNMFWHYCQSPRPGECYNAGGGRYSNCSVLEAIALCEQFTGRKMNVSYVDQHRVADHIWYVSDTRRFHAHYPDWSYRYDLPATLREILAALIARNGRHTAPARSSVTP